MAFLTFPRIELPLTVSSLFFNFSNIPEIAIIQKGKGFYTIFALQTLRTFTTFLIHKHKLWQKIEQREKLTDGAKANDSCGRFVTKCNF